MIIKAVTLFLIFVGVLGMFGKLRMPKLLKRKQNVLTAKKCPKCGAPSAGKSPCPCGHKGSG